MTRAATCGSRNAERACCTFRVVLRVDGRNVRRFTSEQGLAGNDVVAVLEDREGNIWVATDGGVTRLSPSLVSLVNDVGAENGGIAVTRDGSTWIANDNRIVRFSNGRPMWFTQQEGLPGSRITALHADLTRNALGRRRRRPRAIHRRAFRMDAVRKRGRAQGHPGDGRPSTRRPMAFRPRMASDSDGIRAGWSRCGIRQS